MKNGKRDMEERRWNRGFSLIELVVAIALSSIVVYAVSMILRTGNSQAAVLSTRSFLQESARDGVMRMAQELRESSPSRVTVEDGAISFRIPESLDGNGDIIWSDDITYGLGGMDDSQLLRTAPDGSIRVVANNVESVNFTANDLSAPTLVNIRLEVIRPTPEGRNYRAVLSGEVKIRNE